MKDAAEIVAQKDAIKNIDSSRVIGGSGGQMNRPNAQDQLERDRIMNEQARIHGGRVGDAGKEGPVGDQEGKNYNSDMKEYLDDEINKMLGKIKGIKTEGDEKRNSQENGKEDEGSGTRFKGLKSISKTKLPSHAVYKEESDKEEQNDEDDEEKNDQEKVDGDTLLSRVENQENEEATEEAGDESPNKRRRSQALKDIKQKRASDLQHLRDKAGSHAKGGKGLGRKKMNTVLGREVEGPNQGTDEEQNKDQTEEEVIVLSDSNKEENKPVNTDLLVLPGRNRGDTKNSNRAGSRSILKRPGEFRKKARTVLFMDKEIIQEYNIGEESSKVRTQSNSYLVSPNEEFIRKVPAGTIQLTSEQRDKLIEVLEEHQTDDEDIELTLEPEQAVTVVRQNLTGDNATVAVNLTEKRGVLTEGQRRISVYPRDFFAMVEKRKLKGSRMSVYPADFFLDLDPKGRPMRKSQEDIRSKAISVYPKDLFEMAEKEIESGRVSVYPQELFDLFRDFADEEIERPALRSKAASIYPKEFLELAEKQASREGRGKAKSVYPRELFGMAEQEKVDKERVSVYPSDLFKMLNREARQRNVSIYPSDFFELLDKEYGDVVKLSDEQVEEVVKMNTGAEETHIVLSSEQRKTMLNDLKDHRAREEALLSEQRRLTRDSKANNRGSVRSKKESQRSRKKTEAAEDQPIEIDLAPIELNLEADQVMDILNQNCMIEGAELELHQDQVDELQRETKIRPTLIGEEYYDAMVDELVDEFGQRLTLHTLDGESRRSVLKSIGSMHMSVVALDKEEEEDKEGDGQPEVIENVAYDTERDQLVDIKTRKSIKPSRLSQRKRTTIVSRLSRISRASRAPRPSVMAGHAYYDALVDELVDKNGRRHTLKNLNLEEVQDIVEVNEAESIPVVVSNPTNGNVLIVDQVDYMPVEDCLVDEKGTKTNLNDLNEEERRSLMKILGSKRGSVYEPNYDEYDFDNIEWGEDSGDDEDKKDDEGDDQGDDQGKKGIQFKKKDTVGSEEDEEAKKLRQQKLRERRITGFDGGMAAARKKAAEMDKLKIKEPEKDTDPNRNVDNIRNRKGTKYPTKKSLAQMRKEADEKLKEAHRRQKMADELRNKILDGQTSNTNRGSVSWKRSPESSQHGRSKAHTLHPKDRLHTRKKNKTNAGDREGAIEIDDEEFAMDLDSEEGSDHRNSVKKPKKNITERRYTKWGKKNTGGNQRHQTMSGKKGKSPEKGEMEEFAKDYLENEKAKKRAEELRKRRTVMGLKSDHRGKKNNGNRKTISFGRASSPKNKRKKAKTIVGKDFQNKKHDRRNTQKDDRRKTLKDDKETLQRKNTGENKNLGDSTGRLRKGTTNKGGSRVSLKDRQSIRSKRSTRSDKQKDEADTVVEEEENEKEKEDEIKRRRTRAQTKKGKKFLIDNIYGKNYSNQGQIASGHNIISEGKDLIDGNETPVKEKEPSVKSEKSEKKETSEEEVVDLSDEEGKP